MGLAPPLPNITVVADENAVVSRRIFGFASPLECHEIIVISPGRI